jgi:RimJ/RimL family protein N-acetyltransferase
MSSLEQIETPRLVLRRPVLADAEAVYVRYSSDPEVMRFLSRPRHQSVEEARSFLLSCDAEWRQWPAGPYLIKSRAGRLLGSIGLHFETPTLASTGYMLAKDAWGQGYATEALSAVVTVARGTGVRRLYAVCHCSHHASARVLEKCGFIYECVLPRHLEFPNSRPVEIADCLRYTQTLG